MGGTVLKFRQQQEVSSEIPRRTERDFAGHHEQEAVKAGGGATAREQGGMVGVLPVWRVFSTGKSGREYNRATRLDM
jgi:hypothetical protein